MDKSTLLPTVKPWRTWKHLFCHSYVPAPEISGEWGAWSERELELELKVLADVGLVGLLEQPFLVSLLSQTKIGAYHFTNHRSKFGHGLTPSGESLWQSWTF